MRRSLTVLLGLALPLTWVAPEAEASGAAACAITGTINFIPSETAASQGEWIVEPAVISCQGIFRGYERFTGPGTFTGSGTYTNIAGGQGGCHQVGTGTVDYRLQTSATDLHFEEQQEFILAGAGAFSTPTLNGSLQVAPPYDGDCLTSSVTKATFVAQGLMVGVNGLG